ncbi:MAG: hypothetical protein ACRCTA_06805, partial [Bacilli bacterium]
NIQTTQDAIYIDLNVNLSEVNLLIPKNYMVVIEVQNFLSDVKNNHFNDGEYQAKVVIQGHINLSTLKINSI